MFKIVFGASLDGAGFTFMFGLDEARQHEVAADSKIVAFQQAYHYKLFLIITLGVGRLRPDDSTRESMVKQRTPQVSMLYLTYKKLHMFIHRDYDTFNKLMPYKFDTV